MADPQGFTVPTADQLTDELRLARYNDTTNPEGNRLNVNTLLLPSSVGYEVEEEDRENPFSSARLQSVRVTITKDAEPRSSASLTSFDPISGERHTIIGDNDGTVRLLSLGGGIITRRSVALDITNEAADAGITAAQIREMQQRISFDGEVDRAEQLDIINLIGCAQNIARVEPAR